MDIVIDPSPIYAFFEMPIDQMINRFLLLFGWIPIALVFLWGAKELWIFYIQGQWAATQKYIFLAIDVPRDNQQSPKAVENIFTYLAGAHGTKNLIETYWEGQFQMGFSFEIVSIEGYTQFIIRTPIQFRNLTESAIYSQYPDAEITEIDDYTADTPSRFPDEEYDVVGADFIQAQNPAYPIKTYDKFTYQMGAPEEHFKDPMASLMDLCSSLGHGEQLWFQMLILPVGFDHILATSDKEIKKILGEKTEYKKNIVDKAIDSLLSLMDKMSEMIFSIWGDVPDNKKDEADDSFKMMNLKPIEKKRLEAVSEKASKLGFVAKGRFVYFAKQEVKNAPKVMNGFVGYMKQFMDVDLNNIKPDVKRTLTSVSYFFKDKRINKRKNNLMNNYKNRDMGAGAPAGFYTIDELATLWHFPVEAVVKAPMIQKVAGKKSVPPASLPFSEKVITSKQLADGTAEGDVDPIFKEALENGEAKVQAKEKKEDDSNNQKIQTEQEENIFEEDFSEEKQNPTVPVRKKTVKKGHAPENLPFA